MTIITRFAPSPTGLLHVGNIRTALVNWLYTRSYHNIKNNNIDNINNINNTGNTNKNSTNDINNIKYQSNNVNSIKSHNKFILRIDDTDIERSTKKYEVLIKKDLTWLGLDWDITFNQSERYVIYHHAVEMLKRSGRLYACYETKMELEAKRQKLLTKGLPPIYDRSALKLSNIQKESLKVNNIEPHWRFLIQDNDIKFHDLVKGDLIFNSKNFSDPILVRADGSVTYTLASVVDDILYHVTDIIRGEDHLSNSAVQKQIFDALIPLYNTINENTKNTLLQQNIQQDSVIQQDEQIAKTKENIYQITKDSYGFSLPRFAHIPLLNGKNEEISKRIGGFDIGTLKAKGIEPMTINSFFAKIGTSNNVDIAFDMQELLSDFSMQKFGCAAVTYDFEELLKLNNKLIHNMPFHIAKCRFAMLVEDLMSTAQQKINLEMMSSESLSNAKIMHDIAENITFDFWEMIKSNINSLQDVIYWWKLCKMDYQFIATIVAEDKNVIEIAAKILQDNKKIYQHNWSSESIKDWLAIVKKESCRAGKALFVPIRLCITGMSNGPELVQLIQIIGYDITYNRLNKNILTKTL